MLSNETDYTNSNSKRCHFLTFDPHKIGQVKNVYIVAASVDALLIIPTIVLNVLLIISLYQSSEMRKPSTKLLFSLALSDVLVGLLIEPAYLAKKIAELETDFLQYCITAVVTYLAGGALASVSFFTLTAIAIDRYLIIHTGTQYRTMLTNKRVKISVFSVWLAACVIINMQHYSSRSVYFKVAGGITVICVVIASICYIRCFVTLRNQRRLVGSLSEQVSRKTISSVLTYKKSMHTMCYVFLALNLCYLPFVCTSVTAVMLPDSAAIWGAESIATMFIYGNSLVNPIILFFRMKEIRKAVFVAISVNSNNIFNKLHLPKNSGYNIETGERKNQGKTEPQLHQAEYQCNGIVELHFDQPKTE